MKLSGTHRATLDGVFVDPVRSNVAGLTSRLTDIGAASQRMIPVSLWFRCHSREGTPLTEPRLRG